MIAKLLPLIPEHKIYVEVFGGGASLLFAKKQSAVEIYNDIDGNLVNLFKIIRDKEKFEKFRMLVELTLYSREEFNYCLETLNDTENDIEKAHKFFVIMRQSFAGIGNGWGFVTTSSCRGMSYTTSKYLSIIEELPEIHKRLMIVQIENKDFREIFSTYDTPDTFFYCDPPYLLSERRTEFYNNEMSDEDHKELIDILLKLKGKALLSGYKNQIYEKLEKEGWKRLDFETSCHCVGRTKTSELQGKGKVKEKQKRIESVWISPNNKTKFNGKLF